MGLGYGFDIFCDRSRLWEFIDSVVELTGPSVGHSTTITWGDQQKVVPLSLYPKNTLSLDDRNQDYGFCLSLPFAVDDEISNYLKGSKSQLDSEGRACIGCINFYIVTNLDAIGRTGYDANLVCFEFRAVTNDMSRLFQQSQSIHRAFVELAKKHEAVYCMFSSGGQDKAKALWLDGRKCCVAIFDDWLPMSEVRKIVSASTS